MAALPGVISKIGWRDSGSAAARTEVLANLINFPESAFNPDTLPTADGVDARVRSRDEFTIQVYDWSLFAALNTKQIARTELDFQFTFDSGAIYTYDPMRFTARPILSQIPDQCEVFIGATTAANDPTITPADWTSLGSVVNPSQPDFTINAPNQGHGVIYYHSAQFSFGLQLVNDAATDVATTLASYQNAKARIAILLPDGAYTIYESVTVNWQRRPQFGTEQFVVVEMQLARLAADALSIVTPPSTPDDFLFSFEIALQATSATQADYLTIT